MGLVRSLAVSNCTIPMLVNLLAGCEIKPVINQIELHPYMNQAAVLKYHRNWNVAIEGYSSIGGEGGTVLADPVITELAAAKGKTPA